MSYYNESKINMNDGVIVFCAQDISQTTKIIESVYRSHYILKMEFIIYLNKFLNKKENVKNYLVVGDFNIDLLEIDNISQEFLSNFLDKGCIPGFLDVTRPSVGDCKGSCMGDNPIETDVLKTKKK